MAEKHLNLSVVLWVVTACGFEKARTASLLLAAFGFFAWSALQP
jgi:hypothetical protein